MIPERWRHFDELLQAALECVPAERAGFLRQACAGDESLEREVLSLMASQKDAAGFLDPPAIEAAAKGTTLTGEMDPESAWGYGSLGVVSMSMDRYDDVENAMKAAARRNLEDIAFPTLRYTLAFLKRDQAERLRQVALVKGKAGSEDFLETQEAFTLAYFGRMRDSRAMARRASEVAELASERENSALYEAGEAVREAFFGYNTEAKANAAAALGHSKDREVLYGAAFTYALASAVPQAEKLPSELENALDKTHRSRPTICRCFALFSL